MLHLFVTGGQLLHATAIDHPDLSAQTLGAAGGVHRHVTAANDGNLLALKIHDGGIAVLAIGLHEVDTGQELVGGEHALEVLAGDVHKHGQTCAGAHEHGLIALFLHQLIDGDGAAHHGVGDYLNTEVLKALDFLLNDGLGQTELGDAVHQHAAGKVECFIHGDIIALTCQIACTGETGRAGTNDSHLVTVGLGLSGSAALMTVGVMIVGYKTLKAADTHALTLNAADALTLALVLLRADTTADGGQRVGRGDDLIRAVEVALGNAGDKLGNTHVHGAAGDALGILAVEAALCLVNGHFLGIAQCHLVEILIADVGVLCGHGILIQTHICHFT